jgi:hypothetical protein
LRFPEKPDAKELKLKANHNKNRIQNTRLPDAKELKLKANHNLTVVICFGFVIGSEIDFPLIHLLNKLFT